MLLGKLLAIKMVSLLARKKEIALDMLQGTT